METLCLELEHRNGHANARPARKIIDAIELEFFNVGTALAGYLCMDRDK
jgi:hypothetical protein